MFDVLARLPIKSIMRFRPVGKCWKEIFQSSEFKQLSSTLMVYSSPAFVFMESEDESFEQLHKVSLDFLPRPVSVVARCKGLMCCCENLDEIIYICNPLTRSWIKLPEAHELTWWDFIGLTLDSCSKLCTLILGRQEDNDILMEIYNSQINEWTRFQTSVDELLRLVSEGIYSNGKFYLINGVGHDRESFSVVSFDVKERRWKKMKGPEKIISYLIIPITETLRVNAVVRIKKNKNTVHKTLKSAPIKESRSPLRC